VVSLSQVAAAFDDRELTAALATLNTSLYSDGGDNWDGAALGESVRRLRSQHHKTAGKDTRELQLYPGAV
jgi:hypothetical protein